MSKDDVNRTSSSNLDKSKSDSQSNFGKNIGRSEDISNEPSRRPVGDSGMQGNKGRSSQGSSDLGSEGIGSSSSDSTSRGSSSGSERH